MTKVGSQENSNYFNFLIYSSYIDFNGSEFTKNNNIRVAPAMHTVINYLNQFQPAKNQPKNIIEFINEIVKKTIK